MLSEIKRTGPNQYIYQVHPRGGGAQPGKVEEIKANEIKNRQNVVPQHAQNQTV